MELVTTVRNFTYDAMIRNLAPDTHIRVIIDKPLLIRQESKSSTHQLPHITMKEQRMILNTLPNTTHSSDSNELINIIQSSHCSTEPLEL